jgi:hypothetical protein
VETLNGDITVKGNYKKWKVCTAMYPTNQYSVNTNKT